SDLEFVQFHPTALAVDQSPLPLLTEALRGEGARLVDGAGEPLLADHDHGDLAPRDVVARRVRAERRSGGTVELDVGPVDSLEQRFPEASRVVDDTIGSGARFLPVCTAAHYHMGGIATDLEGETNLEGLWACGEVADTGVHGANRLASNSMLECLVFGRRVGRAVSRAALSRRHLRPETLADRRRTYADRRASRTGPGS
ncbi:MAG: FAD-binding protein, partial [Bradymonadaceae bacterium]